MNKFPEDAAAAVPQCPGGHVARFSLARWLAGSPVAMAPCWFSSCLLCTCRSSASISPSNLYVA
jgi:hypothetical protein